MAEGLAGTVLDGSRYGEQEVDTPLVRRIVAFDQKCPTTTDVLAAVLVVAVVVKDCDSPPHVP